MKTISIPIITDFIAAPDKDTEFNRKSIHISFACIPFFVYFDKFSTLAVLIFVAAVYSLLESLRVKGQGPEFFSSFIRHSARKNETRRFIFGPVTLLSGIILSLLLFSNRIACVVIFAVTFGDGFASLVGKFIGKTRPLFLRGKSLEGCLACFSAVFLSSLPFFGNQFFALLIGFTATGIEALPLKDFDNLLIPILSGVILHFALYI